MCYFFFYFFFIYLICKLVMSLRWQPHTRRLTLTGTTGTGYLYSTGQALTVKGGSCIRLPRYDISFITFHLGAKHMFFPFIGKCTLVTFVADFVAFLSV